LQTSKARAEARLEALGSAGINVDEWLAENENLQNDDDDIDDGRAASTHSDLSDRVSACV